MIEFLVQMPDLELRVQIHLVIIFRPQSVARLGTILAHHNASAPAPQQAGKNEIEQNEWIRIECPCYEDDAVDADPDEDHCPKRDQKFPTAAESIRRSFPLCGDFDFLQTLQTRGAVLIGIRCRIKPLLNGLSIPSSVPVVCAVLSAIFGQLV